MRQLLRQLALVILFGLALAACSRGASSGEAVSQSPQASQSSHLSPGTASDTQGQSGLDPTAFRVEPRLSVRTARIAKLYTGRGPWFLLVAELSAGHDLAYLDSREGWVQVRTAAGETGWLAGADVIITESSSQAVHYQIQPGRWRLQVESGLKVEVVRAAPGIVSVAVTGAAEPFSVTELAGGSLLLTNNAAQGSRVAMDIGDSGMTRLSVSPLGILVEVEGRPLHQIVQANGGRLMLEIRPGLEGLQRTESGWLLQMRGNLRPVLRPEGRELVLDLPGALRVGYLSRPLGEIKLPEGIRLQEVEPELSQGKADQRQGGTGQPSSLTASVPTRMTSGGLRLRLPVVAGPYALYRTEAGFLELRFLPSGLKGKSIVLDPGHGGEEIGASGVTGHLEKNVNLAVAMLLKPLLEQAGANVLITRTTDDRVLMPNAAAKLSSLSERTQADLAVRSAMANQAGADLVLSIHANAGPDGDGGTETFWAVSNLNAARSQHLAKLVQNELVEALGLYDRGVKQRPFNIIRYSEAPAVLAELGFMSNAEEERLITSQQGQEAAAGALYRAIAAYFGDR